MNKAGQTSLLTQLCDELIVPEVVVREVRAKPDGEAVIADLVTYGSVKIANALRVPGAIEPWDLGPGESQVLALAASQSGSR